MTPNSDGYDISHWNTIIATPPRFRILAHKLTQGTARPDPKFAERWQMFRDQRTEIMCPYHFLRSTSAIAKQLDNYSSALSQVGALENAGELRQGVLLMTDWEPLTVVASGKSVLVDPVPVDVALEWNAAVTARFGDREITYSSDWKVDFPEWRAAMPDHPLWYANYHLEGARGFWAECAQYRALIGQWTNNARVAGFTDGIDMNHVFDWAAVRRLAGYPQPPPPTEEESMTTYTNALTRTHTDGNTYPPGAIKYAIEAGTLRHIAEAESKAVGGGTLLPLSFGTPLDNDTLDALPPYMPPLGLQGTMGVSGVLGVTLR